MSGLCSLLPFLTGLGSALLGGLIGWHWLKRTRLVHLLGVIDEKDHNYAELRSTHEQHSLRYRSLQGDYLVADTAQKDWETKYHQISDNYRRLDIAKMGLSADFDGFKNKSAQRIAELERQLKELTATHQATKVRLKGVETDFASLKSDYESVKSQNKSFTIQVAKLTTDKKTVETAFEGHKTDATQKAVAADKQYKLLVMEKTKVEKQFADEQAAHKNTYNQWNTQFKDLTYQYESEKMGHADTRKRLEEEVKSITFNWNEEKNNHAKTASNWEIRFKMLTGQFDAEKMAHAKTRTEWDMKYKTISGELEKEKVAHAKSHNDWEMKYKTISGELENEKANFAKMNADRAIQFNALNTQVESEKKNIEEWQLKYKQISDELAAEKATHTSTQQNWTTKYNRFVGEVDLGKAALEQQLDELNAFLTVERENVAQSKANHKADIKALNLHLMDARAAHESEKNSWTTEKNELNSQWTLRINTLQEQYDESQDTIKSLLTENKGLTFQNRKSEQAYRKEIVELEARFNALNHQYEMTLKATELNLKEAIAKLTEKQRELVLELETSEAANKILTRDLDILTGQYHDLNATHFEMASELGDLERVHRVLIADKTQLQENFDELKGKHHAYINDFQLLEQAAQDNHGVWETKYQELFDELNHVTNNFMDANSERATLKGQLGAIEHSYNSLKDTHNTLQSTHNQNVVLLKVLGKAARENHISWEGKFDDLEKAHLALENQYSNLDASAKDWAARYTQLQSDYDDLHNRLTDAETSGTDATKMAEKYQMTIRDLEKRFGALSNEYKGLKDKTDKAEKVNKKLNDALQELEASGNRQIGGWQDKYDQLALSYEESDATVAALKQNLAEVQMVLEAQNAAKEQKNVDYQAKLHALEMNVSNFNALNQQYETVLQDPNNWKNQDVNLENEVYSLRTLIGKLNFDVIGRADENEKEDLSQLTGMDEQTRRRLYALGIYTYRQWANMSAEDMKWLREYLNLNASWDWIRESQQILGWNQGDKKDDLKIIEGIGTKIEQLLFAEGIFTFKQLAATTPERIKAILNVAGPRYRIHNPTTWPEQADMAAKGEWERLKQYQVYLNAGRDLG